MTMRGLVMRISAFVLWMITTTIHAQQFPGQVGDDPWAFKPNDPKYAGMWQVFSHIPVDQRARVESWDAEHGSGMWVDKAWQLHLGSPDTMIAILDSGIRWHEKDLLEQHYLN